MAAFNHQAHDLLGYSAEEFGRLRITDFEAVESPEDTAAHIEEVLKAGHDSFETRHRTKDGRLLDVMVRTRVIALGGRRYLSCIFTDISDRKQSESEREITIEILRLIGRSNGRHALLGSLAELIRSWLGCDAVGFRLRDDDDFPYFETRGFAAEFVEAENRLCTVDPRGEMVRDSQGNPVLECMCGNVICGRFDPAKPFFTAHGSFWTNSTSELLAGTSEADRQARTRNRCHGEGFESVALVPLRAAGETLGLLQINDRRKGRFNPQLIAMLERLAGNVAVGLAHQNAQDLLRENASRLETAVRAGNVGLWWWDLASNRVWYSPEWKRQLGYQTGEISDSFHEWQDRVHPDDIGRCLRSLAAFIDTPVSEYRLEFRMRHKDGFYRWILAQASSLHDNSGRVTRIWGSHIDITDRKQMEAALEASEAHLQAIFRAAPTGIGVVVDRVFQEVNQRVLDMTGYRREELIGQDSRLLYPTDADYDFVGREKYRQIAERGTGTVETLWRCKDGTVINVLLSSTPLDPADHSKGVTFTALEFTDRVRMERSLRESEALLARAEEIGGIGSFIWDFASGRLTWSKGLHALCGLAPGQAADTLDGGIRQAVHPEDQERIRKELNRMVAARRVWPVEFRIVRPDGDERLVQSAGEFVMSDNGLPVRLVGILLDITARRAGENRLEAMQGQLGHASRLATLGELVAGIAHEVNQPLCAIVNFSKAARNLASREPADLEQIRTWADAAASAAAQAGDIVRRLLDFSRRGQPDYETVQVRRLVDDALLLVQHEARLKRVVLHIDVPESLPVVVRTIPIQQVIVNLLRNSIDSLGGITSRDRQVAVRATPLDARVEISVADNGPGVPEADRARLFEPFFTTRPHGVGLGLAISKRIVEEHKGEIWATANPGGGLAVHFTLPTSGD